MDKSTTLELLNFIEESINLVNDRFKKINSIDDFIMSDEGIEKLDSISMRLQSIGEALKNIDKRDRDFLLRVESAKYWKEIIKTRDFISYHYIDIDAEIVYDICENELYELQGNILKLKEILN